MIRKIGFTALVCACLTTATAQADTFKTVPTNGLTWTKHGLDAGAYARLDNLAKTFPRRDLKYVLPLVLNGRSDKVAHSRPQRRDPLAHQPRREPATDFSRKHIDSDYQIPRCCRHRCKSRQRRKSKHRGQGEFTCRSRTAR